MEIGACDHRLILYIEKVNNCDVGGHVSHSVFVFYFFTCCDTTSAFMHRGKVNTLKLMLHSDKHIATFQKTRFRRTNVRRSVLRL